MAVMLPALAMLDQASAPRALRCTMPPENPSRAPVIPRTMTGSDHSARPGVDGGRKRSQPSNPAESIGPLITAAAAAGAAR